MEVHLVDGTYELFRAYYGAPSKTVPGRGEVGATIALGRTLLALIGEGATHVGVAFDHVIESFRNNLFPGYKTGAGIEPDLRAQFEPAEGMVRALGFTVWPMIEFEADDALATAAARAAGDARVDRIVICSPDKDLAQCVRGDDVVLLDRRRKKTTNEAVVLEKFGVLPASIPDWLALVGDAADGIPGIPRWGARSAAAALYAHGTIADIPDDPSEWQFNVRGAAMLGRSLAAHRHEAALYRTLATLRDDIPIRESVDDLEWRGARPGLRGLCLELGTDLHERVPAWR